ncbi:thioredoxin family protein [Chryseotalea sanaruensis]|uniref:Thioredoxin family protein n=1 Tax=Chryseotalea sanaruensis TaxID=2482724 RepID=A0A401U7X3_9BACT|nr:thioredoxin family protein [Chryseotalea sanaruensis]GCC50990.1 thioredoxin family protein [Chryseotalea sanaruensis]
MKYFKSLIAAAFVAVLFVAAKPAGYGVGDTVADFKLKNVDGKMISLADFKSAKGAIVIFDCNTCPYSQKYNDRIIALAKKYSSTFPVVAINSNSPEVSPGDSFEEMVKYAKTKGYTFPYLFDETQEVAHNYGATNTPHVYVLKKEGATFKVAYIGAIDNNTKDAAAADKKYVEEAVDALIAGKAVPTDKTKAIGCTIKWKPA